MMSETKSWLEATSKRIKLPGRPEDQKDRKLVAHARRFAGIFIEAAGAPTSAARVISFSDLIIKLDGPRASSDGAHRSDTPELFQVFTYQPDDILTSFAPDLETERRWSTLVEIYQAWVELARSEQVPQVSAYGQGVALGYLIRARWHLFVAGFENSDPTWLSEEERERLGDVQSAAMAARQCRDEWLDVLDRLEDHPLLARDIDPVAEAELIVVRRVTATALTATSNGASKMIQGNEVDAVAWRHAVRSHLLPRFVVRPAWRVAWRLSGIVARTAMCTTAIAFSAAVTLTLTGLIGHLRNGLLIGAGVSVIGYTGILVAAICERSASWPWLLRQPASAGLGLLVLITLGSDWWKQAVPFNRHLEAVHTRMAVFAALVLLVIGVGYLAVEAVNHGVTHLACRVSAVAGMALLHAFLVTAIGLSIVLPAFAADGRAMAQCWTDGNCGALPMPAWLIFAVATSWCFAAGVFTQVLWDDQPFTAPLAHTRWRTGR